MPNMKHLIDLFDKAGFEIETEVLGDNSLHCSITKDTEKTTVRAIARADGTVCNMGILIGMFDAVASHSRHSLLLRCLELNFDHPLARIGLFRVPADQTGKDEDNTPVLGILIAESSFFWVDSDVDMLNKRWKAVVSIAERASAELASREALSRQNPFYKQFRLSRSSTMRTDLPEGQGIGQDQI